MLTRFFVAFACLAVAPIAMADAPKGESIYRKQCAECHGASGEGSAKEYPKSLAGAKTVPQLARLIAKTMPSDDPGSLSDAEAQAVAAYLHDAFYSQAARDRNKPPRIELSRLTVRQYRNAVTDLVGSFRTSASWGDVRGLRGEYYKSKRFGDEADRVADRVDPEVKFQFGKATPIEGKGDPKEFAIRWQGSVLAPETGEYEFIVKTENGFRLWVNDPVKPLIDIFVKSGNDTEYKATIHLLGGRAYPIKINYFKAKQGVEDSKEKKAKAEAGPGSITLEWKPPGGVAGVIPARNLSTAKFPETFVATTPFPADDRSMGYERGTSISKAWDAATTEAAIEVADYVASHVEELAGVRSKAPDREKRLREFCHKFAERAFRRPLSDAQAKEYVDHQFTAVKDLDVAVKRSVLLVLKSPRFLYREFGGKVDAYDVASRIAFGLWDSLPDQPLLDAAASNQLANRDQVVRQAERMLGDLRTRAKVREFFLQWLKVEGAPDLAKDPKAFPGFDKALIGDLRASLELFLEDVIWSEGSDFRKLLLAEDIYLNGRLASFYGAKDVPTDAPFRKVKLDSGSRAGLLSHPYLMSTFAYTSTSSPIHRGVFVSRSVLGRSLRPPPEAVAPLAPDLHAGLSTRERVALQTSPNACMTCHSMINPLGFGLENFDAVGRFRIEEKGKKVDASGTYETPTGEVLPYNGARGLASLLATSEETQSAFVEQLFHYLVKQPIRAFGPREAVGLRQRFADGGYSIRRLVIDIVADSAVPPKPSNP